MSNPLALLYFTGFSNFEFKCTKCGALFTEYEDGTLVHPSYRTEDYGFLWLKERRVDYTCTNAGKSFSNPLAFDLQPNNPTPQ